MGAMKGREGWRRWGEGGPKWGCGVRGEGGSQKENGRGRKGKILKKKIIPYIILTCITDKKILSKIFVIKIY